MPACLCAWPGGAVAFRNVKRRLELRGTAAGIDVYDDFAHHPTAIATTVAGLRRKVGGSAHSGGSRAALEHHEAGRDEGLAAASLADADLVFCYAAESRLERR
jgi:UDP-N-acetylmuramate: L-alanyl-gamma-D-glutamyl-meso-diaminopimelate ligase